METSAENSNSKRVSHPCLSEEWVSHADLVLDRPPLVGCESAECTAKEKFKAPDLHDLEQFVSLGMVVAITVHELDNDLLTGNQLGALLHAIPKSILVQLLLHLIVLN